MFWKPPDQLPHSQAEAFDERADFTKYRFEYQIAIEGCGITAFTSTDDLIEIAKVNRGQVYDRLYSALSLKTPMVINRYFCVRGDKLLWFWVGEIKTVSHSKDEKTP